MEHFDEHTLELYVVGSDRILAERDEIERHLLECPTCRELAGRMRDFYGDFQKTLSGSGQSPAKPANAIVKSEFRVRSRFKGDATPVHVGRPAPLARAQTFVRKHPVVTSVGSIGALAGLALMLNLAFPGTDMDPNPAYYKFNVTQGLIEIRNAENKKLWDLPSKATWDEYTRADEVTPARSLIIKDIDGDGNNEIISVLPLGEDIYARALRIYDFTGELLHEIPFNEQFQYLDRVYSPSIDIGSLVVDDVLGEGVLEVWITGNSRDRSPNVTIRMDSRGNILGRYWHFGQLRHIHSLTRRADGRKHVVLTGTNDTSDSTHQEFPVVVVLDPGKVLGETRSTLAPGFALPLSQAEMYYISLPETDMNVVTGAKPTLPILSDTSAGIFQVRLTTTPFSDPMKAFSFDFYFDSSFRILEVKSNNRTDAVRENLIKQGLISGLIDRTYLENLKNRVRYWDGIEWRETVTPLQRRYRLATK